MPRGHLPQSGRVGHDEPARRPRWQVSQVVVDVGSALSVEAGLPFGDYTEAVRNLRALPWLDPAVVTALEPLPAFRNIVVHEYAALDYDRVLAALADLEPVERFAAAVARHLTE